MNTYAKAIKAPQYVGSNTEAMVWANKLNILPNEIPHGTDIVTDATRIGTSDRGVDVFKDNSNGKYFMAVWEVESRGRGKR